MFSPNWYDVGGPGLLFAIAFMGILSFVIVFIGIPLLEAVALVFLKWDRFGRSFWAALVANTATSILGLIVNFFIEDYFGAAWFILTFLLSMLVEGGVLMFFKRNAAQENWRAAIVINLASYFLIILPIVLLFT